MKKLLAITIIIFYFFSLSINAQMILSPKTKEILDSSIVLKVKANIAFVSNEKKSIDKDSNIVPFIKNGKTLLPIRFISENLGAEVSWDENSSTAIIKKDDKVIKMTLGNNIMIVNNQEIILEAAPESIEGRIFIPLRDLSEVLGQKVYWHNTGIIILNSDEISFKEDARKELELNLKENNQKEIKNNDKESTDNSKYIIIEENQDIEEDNYINNNINEKNEDVLSETYKEENINNIEIDEKELEQKAKWIEEQVIKEINSLFPKIIIEEPTPEPSKPVIRNLNTLVKPSIVVATIKKNTTYYSSYSSKNKLGTFNKGTSVEIIRDKNIKNEGHWYKIKNLDTGKTGWVLRNSLSIPYDPKTNQDKMTNEEIEEFVKVKGLKSNTDYLIWVDIDRQLTYIFLKKDSKWKLIKTMTCATGKNVSPTVRGTFTVAARGAWMDTDPKGDNVGVMNWVQFYGDYLFHSVIVDSNGKVKDGTQGKRVSHGCIRLTLDDSKWLYDYIPTGTTVFVN